MLRSFLSFGFLTFCLLLVSCEQYASKIEISAGSTAESEKTLYEQLSLNLDGSRYELCENVMAGSRLYSYSFTLVDGQIVMAGEYHGLFSDSNCTSPDLMDYTDYSWQSTILSVDGELGGRLTAEYQDEYDQITSDSLGISSDYNTLTILVNNYCAPWARCRFSQYNIDLVRQP